MWIYLRAKVRTYLQWRVTAVMYDKFSTKRKQLKTLIMRFVGTVASVLVSGSYYNGGGAIVNNALKTSNSTWHSSSFLYGLVDNAPRITSASAAYCTLPLDVTTLTTSRLPSDPAGQRWNYVNLLVQVNIRIEKQLSYWFRQQLPCRFQSAPGFLGCCFSWDGVLESEWGLFTPPLLTAVPFS
jgi:hypothetical protein